KHQGALKLCNDIGVYNNFQLDAVRKNAFKGNQDLRVVYFTDLKGTGAYGDSYTGFEMTLEDSCFADTKNLADIDMLYLVTDGDNHIDPITPQQLKLGKGVFDGSTARIKMMPQQVAWFEADTTWNKYRDRFLPSVVKVGDEGIKKALKQMAYKDMAATGYDVELWTDYIDFARIAGAGFSWLDGKFTDQKDNIRSFADFKHFESVGLDYVGKEWFKDCDKLSNILLPSTVKRIGASAFQYCSSLQEIEIPAGVEEIESMAFAGCNKLNRIVVRGEQPAKIGAISFEQNSLLKIYVPAGKVNAYKQAWPAYADCIVGMDELKVKKSVTVSTPGTLAEELGLNWEWDYSGVYAGDEPRYLMGNYSRYDSLTVSGPLNNVDLATLRYLAGCDSYTRLGAATDGKLRYLNLKDASIRKDDGDKAHYYNHSHGLEFQWYDIKSDDVLPTYLFNKCTSLETVILPSSLSSIGNFVFLGCSALKRVALTGQVKQYATWENVIGELEHPLEELVFMTDNIVVSDDNDPWGQPIQQVYTKKSQFSDYQGQPYLTNQAQSITALFEDDAVMESLSRKGEYFPSEYLARENVDDLFRGNVDIRQFDDFYHFQNVKQLDLTFENAYIESITLPKSIERIGSDAFSACYGLKTISLSCDTVPVLGEAAFRDLPDDFQILVPKNLCKLYRTKWPQYASHINPDLKSYAEGDIMVVTTKEKNTLARELGLQVTYDTHVAKSENQYNNNKVTFINSVRGDYSDIKRLKVVGPISGADLCLLRYLAGFCAWANTRNYFGQLEYIDLYDAELQASEYEAASDMYWSPKKMNQSYVARDNELPAYAFLQAYSLKTLILPKTVTKVESRALQECESLETLVIGDETTAFNWSALDDCASLSKMYILAKQKPALPMDCWLWRNLCNNYHPTFDAFYVRPSLFQEYLKDDAYTGMTWQRTNNISKGEFADDESFCAFAAHAAATKDDLLGVDNVEGWFKGHEGIRDLTPLKYTAIDSLSRATLAPLTQLETIALPEWLTAIEDGAFTAAANLRYVDMLACDTTVMIDRMKNGGLKRMGINTDQTLVYVPQQYGETDEVNVIWGREGSLQANTYRLVDGLDYNVPYTFQTQHVRNSRKIAESDKPYTLCLPYQMSVAGGARLYALIDRSGATLTFSETDGQGEAMK
ncbi:MAG: leucine-rich repeat protein, partial [Prevotella sp.]|nr:leucine-rich repeat protein [Prevotella sp.]